MTQGYYAGISGIQTHQSGLDVVSDNLANISTTGYKGLTTEFSDLFNNVLKSSNATTPTSDDIGLGVKLQATTLQMQQGALMPSDRFNDLAIEGNGWFGATSGTQDYFTRDGHFTFDAYQKTAGDLNSSTTRLVTADGKFVTGTMLANFDYNASFDYGDSVSNGTEGAYVISDPTSDVVFSGVNDQVPLEFPTRLAYPVVPTSQTQFFGNIGITNEVRSISADVISASNERNRLKLTFTQSAIQPSVGLGWDVEATVTSNDGSVVYDTQNGQAFFGESGALSSFNIASVNNDGTPISIDLGNNYNGVVAIDSVGINGSSQSDGTTGGALTNYGINSDGVIIADFSNGRQSAIGRVAVYHFKNDQGLERNGGSYYQQSSNSGKPHFWTDTDGNAITGATIRSGMLEASNVRMEVGLTDMIVLQRAYQANAKTITTVDEMIQKALQMRR